MFDTIVTLVGCTVAGFLFSLTPIPYIWIIARDGIRKAQSEGPGSLMLFLLINVLWLIFPAAVVLIVIDQSGLLGGTVFALAMFHVLIREHLGS